MSIDEIFQGLASLSRWAPYKLVYDPRREKYDKIPSNGRHGISTKDLTAWKPLVETLETAKEQQLGVGFVMTGGIEFAGWQLLGFDFDDVDFEKFTPPLKTYTEKSPSKTGIRMFAWVPSTWASRFQDSLDTHPKHCKHAEMYLGTAPRFLTVTFDQINEESIAQLKGNDLLVIESWGMREREALRPLVTMPDVDIGTPVHLPSFHLTMDQKILVDGTGELDRSAILHGLLIKLIDGDAPNEDILATITKTPALWKYCLDHRNEDTSKAIQFAREEINHAYAKSKKGMREALIGYNDKWKTDASSWLNLTLKDGAVTDDDLHTEDPPWECAIDNFRPRKVGTIFAGAHGLGKSTEGLFQELAVATGREHWGMPVTQGRAIFISCEDPRRIIKSRMQAWLKDVPDVERPSVERAIRKNFYFFGSDETDGMKLTVKAFAECQPSREAIEHLVALGQDAVSITIETVAMLNSGDEMNPDLMQMALVINEIARRTGASVQVIHHVSKDARSRKPDSYSMRGGSSLADAARSVVMMQELSDEQMQRLSITRLADAPVFGLYHVKSSYSKPHPSIYIRRLPGPKLLQVNASETQGKEHARNRFVQYLQKPENREGVSVRHLKDNCTKFKIEKREVESVLLKLEELHWVKRVDSTDLGKAGPKHDIWMLDSLL